MPNGTDYQWLITADDVGNPHDSPANCRARPVRREPPGLPGQLPVALDPADAGLRAGRRPGRPDDLSRGTPLSEPARRAIPDLGDRGRLQDRRRALHGRWSAAPNDGSTTRDVNVAMQPYPLPLGTVRLRVFNDNMPVDGTYEVGAGARRAWPGSPRTWPTCSARSPPTTTATHCARTTCTRRRRSRSTQPSSPGQVDIARPRRECLSDAAGDIVIPNLGPDRYAAQVAARRPARPGCQTTTLEGAHDWDIWVQEGDTGFDTERASAASRCRRCDFGFVAPQGAARHAPRPARSPGGASSARTYVGGNGGVTRAQRPGVAGASSRRPGQPAVGGAVRPGQQRPDGLRRPRRRGRHVRHPQRPQRQLPADAVGRPAGQHPRLVQRDRRSTVDTRRRRARRPWSAGSPRSAARSSSTPTATASATPARPGVPQFPVGAQGARQLAHGPGQQPASPPTPTGNYASTRRYPMTKWLVLEALQHPVQDHRASPTRRTTSPTATTFSARPSTSTCCRSSACPAGSTGACSPTPAAENGGIVGTVTYDTTRNELDPRVRGHRGATSPASRASRCTCTRSARDPTTATRSHNPDGSIEARP